MINITLSLWREHGIRSSPADEDGPAMLVIDSGSERVSIFFTAESKLDELIKKLQELKGGEQNGKD